jgi:putative ABC transport system substrate-binding protein
MPAVGCVLPATVQIIRCTDRGASGAKRVRHPKEKRCLTLTTSEANEIERAIGAFARAPNTGLIVTSSAFTIAQRDLIITLAGHHRLPAIYPFRFFSTSGGLMSYGPNQTDQWRLASGYVDRILRGEKPADLPVQMPTRYELVINLKTAKALGLEVPPTLLAGADEVTE